MLTRLKQAIEMAQAIESDARHYRLAAIAIREDGTLVRSTNLPTKDPEPRVHAESRVMLKAGWGATVYVARVLRNGDAAMSKPCGYCQSIMKSRGVKKVFYTINEKEYGCLTF